MNILVINQYFPPDRAATSLLLGQLVEDCAQKDSLRVICGMPTYDPETTPLSFHPNIRRSVIPLIPLSRKFLWVRILNYFLFFMGAWIRAWFSPKPDLVICWTDPPWIGLVGAWLKRVKKTKFIFVSQDVYPEILQASQTFNSRLGWLGLSKISSIILNHADAVVALGDRMKQKIQTKTSPQKIHVIPNWQDLKPIEGKNSYRPEKGFSETDFIVMHSGNLGISQDIESLLQAAQILLSEAQIKFVLIGDGGKKKWLQELAKKLSLSNTFFFPYEPSHRLPFSLGSADVHYVSLLPAFSGLIVPSKIYGILAMGKPVLANVPKDSEIADMVRTFGFGEVVSPDPSQMAFQLKTWAKNRPALKQMGEQALSWHEKFGGRKKSIDLYQNLIDSLALSHDLEKKSKKNFF